LLDFIPMLKMMSEVDDVRPFILQTTKDNIMDLGACKDLMRGYFQQLELMHQEL